MTVFKSDREERQRKLDAARGIMSPEAAEQRAQQILDHAAAHQDFPVVSARAIWADTSARPRMNETEKRYADRLDQEIAAGTVARWRFGELKFRLADGTWYTPDFCVQRPDGTLELHETKGAHVWDDSRVKAKVAAEQYREFRWFWCVSSSKKEGWTWSVSEL